MSDLLKLENIRKKNGHIKAFTIGTNMIQANTGKNGWGYVKIAIDNASVVELATDRLIGVLYLVDEKEFKECNLAESEAE